MFFSGFFVWFMFWFFEAEAFSWVIYLPCYICLGMDFRRLVVLFLATVLIFGLSAGYESSIGGDVSYPGDPSSTSDPGTPSPDPEDSFSCWNEADDDNDSKTDVNDPGCVEPGWNDEIEGMIWDPHLLAEMEGFDSPSDETQEASYSPSASTTEAVFFQSFVKRGNEFDGRTFSDSDDGSSVTIHWVDAIRGEGSDNGYGFGFNQSKTFDQSDFSSYSGQDVVIQNGRVIDAPHDLSEVCGNGFEEENFNGPEGDETGTASTTIDCKKDIGAILEKFYIHSPYERDGLDCADDEVTCEVDTETCETTKASCGSESCSCPAEDGSADATCETSCEFTGTGNNSDDESNTYYLINDDTITTHSCQDDGGPVDSANCEITESECSVSSKTCDYKSPSGSCDTDSSCTAEGASDSDSSYSELGRERKMKQIDSYNCYDQHSRTDGGGDKNSDRADNDPAGTYTRFTAHADNSWDTDNGAGVNQDGETQDGTVWCGYDYALTVNADGPQGNGDGFIVIDENAGSSSNDIDRVVARESPDGSASVGRNVHTGTDGNASSVESTDYIDQVDLSCSGDKEVCIKYVDFYTKSGSGTEGSPEWESVDDAVQSQVVYTGTPDQSYSVCKAINRINEKNGDSRGDDLVDCDYTRDDDSDGEGEPISPLPEACGDEPSEHLMLMEGPEVNHDTVEKYLFHEQKCVDWAEDTAAISVPNGVDENACVNKGKVYAEGTVAPVYSSSTEPGYEKGQDSPDWEVCLNIDHSNTEKSYNHRHDDTSNNGYGGQWYNLDDERVNQYLRNNEGRLGLSTSFETGSEHYIDYYYGENPNPQHSTYNPKGGRKGTSLIADCGPGIECGNEAGDTRGGINAEDGTFFSFFRDYTRDEDFHPQGEDTSALIEPVFEGVLTKIKKHSQNNQLNPPHYDYDVYDPNWYRDTQTGEDQAVQYAYVEDKSWVVDSTGVPYPPWGESGTGYASGSEGVHYREGYSGFTRQNPTDDTVQKTSRAFGNSLGVVAQQTIGSNINPGEGFWIDPDNIREHFNDGLIDDGSGSADGWKNFVSFKMDLTGPDSGLGWDYSGTKETREGGNVIFTDITWEENDAGDTREELQTPLCGDDRYEYLIEEMGESRNSEQYTGKYGCATRQDICYSSNIDDFTQVGSYQQTDEPTEDVGRYKQDEEYCGTTPEDIGVWWDQDFRSDICRGNSLYGSEGVRWFDEGYIQDHPHAVTGGIDDSWSDYMGQKNYDDWDSLPNKGGGWDFGTETPVPTGTNRSKTASLGFCGGDDGGEYLVTQECDTSLCDTKRRVQGVAKTPGSCVFDGSQSKYPVSGNSIDVPVSERTIYEPGENITVDLNSQRSIVCFGGSWHEKTPISFSREELDVPLNEEVDASFRVINVRDQEATYEVSMVDPLIDELSVYQLSSFKEKQGDSFRVTLGGGESREYGVRIRGGTTEIDGDKSEGADKDNLELEVEGINSDVGGYDTLTVNVTDTNMTGIGNGSEPESVPGVGAVQLLALVMMASVMFFFQS